MTRHWSEELREEQQGHLPATWFEVLEAILIGLAVVVGAAWLALALWF
jgi:hypothetical protein